MIYETWGLKAPAKCKVYIMTSWVTFILHGFSFLQKFLLLVLFLILYIMFPYAIPVVFLIVFLEIRKRWSKIAGLTVPNHTTCGIKSPDLVDPAGGKLGRKIYIEYANSDSLVQAVICHELTHAFSIHLKLPVWLSEGIAMYTVDKFTGKTTVKAETVKDIEAYPYKKHPTN